MKISCTQENLNKGLNIVSHIASKHTTLPILNNVLIKAENNIITLSTTNLEIGINCNVRGKIEQEGIFTVQAKLLSDYINLLPKEQINLTVNNNVLEIESSTSKTKINGLPADDFPVIPQINKRKGFKLKTKLLKETIPQIIFAAANDDTRPELNGILSTVSDNLITLTSTDSFRLSEKKLPIENIGNYQKNIIVPLKTFQEVNRILSDDLENESTFVYISENQICFLINNIELTSRLVEGQFPDYRQLLLNQFNTTAVININTLINAIKSASLFCKIAINDVTLKFISNENTVIVESSNSQLGESTLKIPCEIIGKSNEIVLNYRYLLDGLNVINSNDIEMKIFDENTQTLLKPKDSDNFRYILLPVILE
jgi:DNA polymerase-3 subunit beta